jgi:hypothetical protein
MVIENQLLHIHDVHDRWEEESKILECAVNAQRINCAKPKFLPNTHLCAYRALSPLALSSRFAMWFSARRLKLLFVFFDATDVRQLGL